MFASVSGKHSPWKVLYSRMLVRQALMMGPMTVQNLEMAVVWTYSASAVSCRQIAVYFEGSCLIESVVDWCLLMGANSNIETPPDSQPHRHWLFGMVNNCCR
jgi:hypothetical protein